LHPRVRSGVLDDDRRVCPSDAVVYDVRGEKRARPSADAVVAVTDAGIALELCIHHRSDRRTAPEDDRVLRPIVENRGEVRVDRLGSAGRIESGIVRCFVPSKLAELAIATVGALPTF
jgi:hypothetical protein